MIITVLGANGQTGAEVVRQVLEAGHSVHAIVRRAESLPPRAGLEVFVGDVTDPTVIAKASEGTDAIVSALGSLKTPLMTPALRAVIEASESTGVKRFVPMSAYVVLRDRLRPGLKLASHLGMKMAIEDKTAGEALLRSSGLNWTIAYVSTLTDRPGTGRVREVPPTERLGMRHRISRADSAAWMLKSVCLEEYFRAGAVLAQ
ncbi:NAD(P)-binding oxidoreductase [Actinacidiphila oryziradicis]|uniref:NAD(P)-dependent oxidoreductase n=1 Tax=Actinacidiphila oryziradicis TaxID=2571141 RepID=UPI0023EFD820|nr:NAD(P)-binding oxidoreductase [Actinacidiphila oryziradicis]MCW2873661.1 yhfK 1 [Actinacidiphila oryziradicis]